MKRIAGAFSHALISSNHLRTFDVHPRDRPLFTIASANCFTTPWLMLRVCLRVCSGKRKRFLFFSFPFLLFSLPFKARPRKQREWVLPRGWPSKADFGIFSNVHSYCSHEQMPTEVLYLSVPLKRNVALCRCNTIHAYFCFHVPQGHVFRDKLQRTKIRKRRGKIKIRRRKRRSKLSSGDFNNLCHAGGTIITRKNGAAGP